MRGVMPGRCADMPGLRSKRKGKAGELEACPILRELIGDDVRRNLGAAEERGGDLVGSFGIFGIEVKRAEQVLLPAWWAPIAGARAGAALSTQAACPISSKRAPSSLTRRRKSRHHIASELYPSVPRSRVDVRGDKHEPGY
jgi:hypothetical protein